MLSLPLGGLYEVIQVAELVINRIISCNFFGLLCRFSFNWLSGANMIFITAPIQGITCWFILSLDDHWRIGLT